MFASAFTTFTLSVLIAICLALTHLFSGKLRFVNIYHSHWLSAAGGVSVAYVFVHILPELSKHQAVLKEVGEGIIPFLEHHVYLIALLGITVFYGLERIAIVTRFHRKQAGKGDTTSQNVFWLHMVSFGLYNALIGYLLLHREEPGIISLVVFSLAMATHFIVNDFGLREHHQQIYDRLGRWILATAIIVGWVIGAGTQVNEAAIAVLFSFLAGGIVLNVLKEELPQERESRFWAFALGAAGYAILLISI
jgi:zinc transporter ZupT